MRAPRLTNRTVAVAACSLIAAGSLLTPAAATILPQAAQAAVAHNAPEAPTFSVPGGTYDAPVKLKLSAGKGETIRYTTDGTIPTKASRAAGSNAIVVSRDTNLAGHRLQGKPGRRPALGGLLHWIRRAAPGPLHDHVRRPRRKLRIRQAELVRLLRHYRGGVGGTRRDPVQRRHDQRQLERPRP